MESPREYFPKYHFRGKVVRCDSEYIYVEIFREADVPILKIHCENTPFDMHFKVNRLPYQIQHKTLDLIYEYDLHSLLIANKHYELNPNPSKSDHEHLYEFRGNLTADLNSEQKLVVSSILKMSKILPYLLFGPAGIFILLCHLYRLTFSFLSLLPSLLLKFWHLSVLKVIRYANFYKFELSECFCMTERVIFPS